MDIVVSGYAGFDGSRSIYQDKVYRERLLLHYNKSFFSVFSDTDDKVADGTAESRIDGNVGISDGAADRTAESRINRYAGISDGAAGDAAEGVRSVMQDGAGAEADKHAAARREFDGLLLKNKELGLAVTADDGGVLAALWHTLKGNYAADGRKYGAEYSLRAIPVLQQTIEICETFGLDPYRLSSASCAVWLTEDAVRLKKLAAAAGLPAEVIGFTKEGAAIIRTDKEEPAFLRRPEPDELYRLFPTGTFSENI